jgi:ribonuclease VapC
MTIDTSALVAILFNEPERLDFNKLVDDDPRCIISTVSVLEASMVVESRFGTDSGADLDIFLADASVEIVSFDADQLAIARRAFRQYGKGRHRAGLNFGDCAAYALSRWSGEPLLFKGEDFAATDVARVR